MFRELGLSHSRLCSMKKGGGEDTQLSGYGFGSELNPSRDEGMVEMEIDAARVLADMAVVGPASREAAINREEDRSENDEEVVVVNEEKKEREMGASTSQAPYGARRGKQVLTEAEKEAKRLRRVLANRESARQTILRRQALREELAQKVVVLSSENQNVKMKKEKATKEYLSLKETNRQLKEQLANLTMLESSSEIKQQTETDSSATRISLNLYSMPPVMPYIWSPWAPNCLKIDPRISHTQDYVKIDPNSNQCSSAFSYTPVYQVVHETASGSGTKPYEEKQLLPSMDVDESTDVSCSLTLGLEIGAKPKSSMTEVCMEENTMVICGGKTDNMKLAAEARRRRREITRLKQMQRRIN